MMAGSFGSLAALPWDRNSRLLGSAEKVTLELPEIPKSKHCIYQCLKTTRETPTTRKQQAADCVQPPVFPGCLGNSGSTVLGKCPFSSLVPDATAVGLGKDGMQWEIGWEHGSCHADNKPRPYMRCWPSPSDYVLYVFCGIFAPSM